MKKSTIAILSSSALMLFMAASALAATNVSFTPQNINVTKGQDFTVTVSLDPQGVKNYTAKIELQYPAGLIQVKTFSSAGNWMVLSQPGYDLIDNNSGILIKTAGYPGGFSAPVDFGTIVFTADESGNGNIQVSANSFTYDENSQNVINKNPIQAQVIVSTLTPIPTPTPIPTLNPVPNLTPSASPVQPTPVSTLVPEIIVSPTPTFVPMPTLAPSPTPQPRVALGGAQQFLAAIGNFFSLKILLGIIVIIIAIGVVLFILSKRKKKDNK